MAYYAYICGDLAELSITYKPLDLAYSIKTLLRLLLVCLISFQVAVLLGAEEKPVERAVAQHHQDDGHDHHGHDDHHEYDYTDYANSCGTPADPYHAQGYDPTATAIHHISDANVYTILDAIRIPLPTILYSKEDGLKTFMSSKFGPGHHDDGHLGYHGYVMHHGNIYRVKCSEYRTMAHFEVEGFNPKEYTNEDGKQKDKTYAVIGGKAYELEKKTIWDGGMLGGGVTSFYDLSLTKNVVSMILISLLMFFLFRKAATSYQLSLIHISEPTRPY